MRQLLRHWRRLLLGLFLFALGYVLYLRLPPVERWSVRLEENAETVSFSFSEDGRFVFSYRPAHRGGNDWSYGPFRKRDVVSGQLLAEASAKERIYQSHSVDDFDENDYSAPVIRKRFWAGLPKNEKGILELFELDSGKERRLPIKSFSGERRLSLSPAEDMVAIFCFKNPEERKEAEIFLHALPGGERLAILSTTAGALFSPDGSYFVYTSTTTEGPCLRLWDTRKRESGGVLPGAVEISDISPNGRFLLAWPVDGDKGKTKLWDLSDPGKPRGVAVLPAPAPRLQFAPDSRTLVKCPMRGDPFLVFWDSATGRETGRIPASLDLAGQLTFSTDNRLLAIREGQYAGNFPVAVFDVPSRKLLWHKQLGEPMCLQGSYLPVAILPGDVDTLFLGMFDDERHQHPQFRNARSGELLATFSMPFKKLGSSRSEDGRRILIYGHGKRPAKQKQGWFWETLRQWLPSNPDRASDLFRVIDVPTLREVFHLADSHVEHAQLSPDGSTLLTLHSKDPAGPHLRCWDVPALHPWLKIAGIPAGIGSVLLLLGKWRQVRKARKTKLLTEVPCSAYE
jgi:WD40 repeat protein